jgi:hypothetical protein
MRNIAESLHPASKGTLASEIQYNLALSSAGAIRKEGSLLSKEQFSTHSDTCTVVFPAIDF